MPAQRTVRLHNSGRAGRGLASYTSLQCQTYRFQAANPAICRAVMLVFSSFTIEGDFND